MQIILIVHTEHDIIFAIGAEGFVNLICYTWIAVERIAMLHIIICIYRCISYRSVLTFPVRDVCGGIELKGKLNGF